MKATRGLPRVISFRPTIPALRPASTFLGRPSPIARPSFAADTIFSIAMQLKMLTPLVSLPPTELAGTYAEVGTCDSSCPRSSPLTRRPHHLRSTPPTPRTTPCPPLPLPPSPPPPRPTAPPRSSPH